MPRLIDRIVSGEGIEPDDEFIRSSINDSMLIVADNIAHYYFVESERNDFGLEDFPNLAPPFDQFFIEFRMPSSMNVGGVMQKTASGWIGSEVGLLVRVHDPSGEDELCSYLQRKYGDPWPAAGKWLIDCSLFIRYGRETIAPCAFFIMIDSEGKIIKTREMKDNDPEWEENGIVSGQPFICIGDPKYYDFLNEQTEGSMLYPIFLAISFMHCKNVRLVEEDQPKKLSMIHQRKTGKPLLKYHVLSIDPMKKILRSEGNQEKTGLKKALHICRGHFKDYREHGLFGKNKGLYWWDSHARGSHVQGIIDKDYRVKPNKN